jgi:APA family basic amino acid/polyamine antiporter
MAATALIFFAYIGFEDVAGIAEEVKRPRRTIPLALLLSLAISTALYIAVTVAAIGVLGWERLSASPAPLADVMSSAFGQGAGTLLAFIALAATSNTVLISLICGSRVLYGVASHDGLPRQLAMIGKRRTPTLAVFFAGFFALVALFISDIRTIAELTDVGIFIIYFAVNASLIWLRFKNPSAKRPFKSPSIGRIPIVALIGAFGCVLLLFSINPLLLAGEAALLAIGFVIYKIIKARQQR